MAFSKKNDEFCIAFFISVPAEVNFVQKKNNLFSSIASANMKIMPLQWWDIYACPMLFLTKKFLFRKKYDFFVNF